MKFRLICKLLIVSLVAGIVLSFFLHEGYANKLFQSFGAVPIYGYFIIVILTLFLLILIHELGHFFAFLVQGIPVRALYVFIFRLYKQKNKWKIKVVWRQWVLLGGLVVPDLLAIENELDFKKTTKKFANALIAAPIVTLIVGIFVPVFAFVLLFLSTSLFWIGTTTIASFIVALFTWIAMKSFSISTEQIYGDFVAQQKMKTDHLFQLAMILQYTQFSFHQTKVSQDFIWNEIIKTLRDESIQYTQFYFALLGHYFQEIVDQNRFADPLVHQQIQKASFNKRLGNDAFLLVSHLASQYFYSLKDVKKAYDIYRQIKPYKSDLNQYLVKHSEHVMHIHYHDDFEINGSKKDFSWILQDLIVNPPNDDHQPLPFVVYQSSVEYLYEQEEADQTVEMKD